jgi:hypothetical protein
MYVQIYFLKLAIIEGQNSKHPVSTLYKVKIINALFFYNVSSGSDFAYVSVELMSRSEVNK